MPVVVQTWCPGTPLLTLLEKKPWAVGRLGRLFGRTQARLHMTPAPPEFAATAPADWLSRVPPEYARLAERSDASTGTLVHLDYHPLNVIVDGSGDASVIDWAYAAAGDARADLAVTATTLMAAPIPPGPLKPLLNLARTLMARAWRVGYCEIAGAMPDYRPFLAWSGAMILLGTQDAIGRPNVWGTEKDVEALRRLIDARARRSRIESPLSTHRTRGLDTRRRSPTMEDSVTGQEPTEFMKEYDPVGDKSPKNTAKTNKQKSQKKAPKSSKK